MDLVPISLSFALLLSTVFLPQQAISHATISPAFTSAHDSIRKCLIRHSVPLNLLFSPHSRNYSSAFSSPVQNERVILGDHAVKPLIIVTPTLESHAQAAVICSRQHNFMLRTRSGGHDYEGLSYTSTFGPFLMLDLLNLRSVTFDRQNTAWVQSGTTLGELYFAIASRSRTLAFPAGFYPTVGVGGHISGGGIGTISRAHGISVDHVVDARIINAAGQILERESMGEDLFWALRGGGGASFGVILAYKIKLVEVPPNITVCSKNLTLSQGATRALAQWQQAAYRTDDRLYINAVLSSSNKSVQVTFSSVFLGEKTELIPIMDESFPALQVTATDCREMSWIESLVVFAFYPLPNINGGPLSILLFRAPLAQFISFKVKSDIVTEPIAEHSWEEIWNYILNGDEQPTLLMEPFGGKIAEIPETETPFPHRNGSKFVIQYILVWLENGEKAASKHIDWLRRFYKFMAPFVSKKPRAAYLNFRDLDLGRNREGMISYDKGRVWGKKYYKVNFRRLARAKSETDPANYFKNEQSIPPLF